MTLSTLVDTQEEFDTERIKEGIRREKESTPGDTNSVTQVGLLTPIKGESPVNYRWIKGTV